MSTTQTRARARRPVPEQRVAFFASWDLYEALAGAIGDHQPVRLAFDGERVELMSPSEDHEELRVQFGCLVRGLAAGLGVACKGIGATTQKRPPGRGVEPDTSFYLTPEKVAAARRAAGSPHGPGGPVPDLAVEIDLTPSALDRPAIYAALGVPEVWVYDGERVVIERLSAGGTLDEAAESGSLGVRPDEVARLMAEDVADDDGFIERVKGWAREVVAPRRGP